MPIILEGVSIERTIAQIPSNIVTRDGLGNKARKRKEVVHRRAEASEEELSREDSEELRRHQVLEHQRVGTTQVTHRLRLS